MNLPETPSRTNLPLLPILSPTIPATSPLYYSPIYTSNKLQNVRRRARPRVAAQQCQTAIVRPKPNPPELFPKLTKSSSTMARSFSLALNDLFKIDNSLADLDAAVSEKCVPPSSQPSHDQVSHTPQKESSKHANHRTRSPRSPPKSHRRTPQSPRRLRLRRQALIRQIEPPTTRPACLRHIHEDRSSH